MGKHDGIINAKSVLAAVMAVILVLAMMPGIANAKGVSKSGLKYLKGTWVSIGHSHSTKVKFTKKKIKYYSRDSKGKWKCYLKYKILKVVKKGKQWIVKGKMGGNYVKYKSHGKNLLDSFWKEKGSNWYYSGSSSLQRK